MTAATSSAAWSATNRVATGATMWSRNLRLLVDADEVVGAGLAGGRAALGALEGPSLHAVRSVDAGEVEDRRGDVDQGHEAPASGGGRAQQPGRDPGACRPATVRCEPDPEW